MTDVFSRPDPAVRRSERVYAALARLGERHAASPEDRHRHLHADVAGPQEVVRLVAGLTAGAVPVSADEDEVDRTDLTAALTLMPEARADLDEVELALLQAARAREMTWQEIAFALGLNSPQAARQRFERLTNRTDQPAS